MLHSGCSGSSNIENGSSIPAGKLIGSWRTEYNLNSKRGILTFRPDSTFVDSVFTITSDSLKIIPELVVKGSYSVDGPLIKFRSVSVMYPDFQNSGSVKSWYKYIDNLAGFFSGEKLFLQPVIEFMSGSISGKSLSGRWVTERWVCTYNENLQPHINNGFVRETYDFDSLSMKCRISKGYLFENSPASTDTVVNYTYSNRELILGNAEKKWIVFYNNKVYWFNQNYYSYNLYTPGGNN